MRSITKGNEPVSLLQHRLTPHSDFDNFEDKDILRQALVSEQRALCCYCMGRIHPSIESMKIEHWRCQANYPTEQLRYRNLLGACIGGEGQPLKNQHCDTRKGDRDLRLNPADPTHQVERRVIYLADGSILGSDPEFNGQLNDVLNLNLPLLKQQRKSLLDAVLGWWKVERDRLRASVPRDRLIRKRDKYLAGRWTTWTLLPGRCLVAESTYSEDNPVIEVRYFEKHFETFIEDHLLANGYVAIDRDGFDRDRAIFPDWVLGFIRSTQPREWKRLESLHGPRTGEQVISDLCKWMGEHGVLATLRHGFKCYGRTLRVAYFKASHKLNAELEALYAANRLGITRQLRYSPRCENSLDIVLSLNGIPVVTAELKNPLTGQRVEDASRQYQQDRDPREPIFEFKCRTLVHFAADTDSVLMTTRLAGKATRFLPFDKGYQGSSGNPPDPVGRTYRTAYLWEEILERDSLLDILARFVHLQTDEKRDEQGRKVKTQSMIFPRYHQLEVVRRLENAARREGVGHNYLVEHSAGSGKSNTIGWLTHRLASLHNDANERIFDSVIVVTDRVVLDQQLQNTIYQFEHKLGVVQRIDRSSRQLAEALESAVPVIVTTLQSSRSCRGICSRWPKNVAGPIPVRSPQGVARHHRRGT